MPSPYITITERDESTYTVTSSNTIVALCGFSTKGPVDTPTFLTSKKQFQNTFGLTPSSQPYSHLAAYKYFDNGNALWFTRIADSTTALESYSRVLTNDGTGTTARLISTNSLTTAAFSTGSDYSVKVSVEVDGIDYEDTLTVNLVVATDMAELITKLTNEISNSSDLNGKVIVKRCKIDGNVSSTPSENVYLMFETVNTGSNDAVTIDDPDSGNSLLSNGSVGFSYSTYTAWGNYSSPDNAYLTGNIDLATAKDLSSLYNMNFWIDDDVSSNTVDLASRNKAYITGDTAYTNTSTTTADGYNPARYNISLNIDGVGATNVDLTGNAGINATHGYQLWPFTSATTLTSSSGLSRYGYFELGGTAWTGATLTNAAGGVDYDFGLEVSGVDLGGGAGVSVNVTINGANQLTLNCDLDTVIASMVAEIDDLNGGIIAGKYTLAIVGGDIRLTLADTLTNQTVTITAGSIANLFALTPFAAAWATRSQSDPVYEIDINIDGVGVVTYSIDGSSDITTISGLLAALDASISSGAAGAEFIASGGTGVNISALGGQYGSIAIYSDTRGTETSVGVTPSSIVVSNAGLPTGNNRLLSTSVTNWELIASIPSAIDGLDVVLTQAQILSAIEASLGDVCVASFNSSNYLVVTSKTYGRSGSVTLAAGTKDASAFFESAPPKTGNGGEATTKEQIVEAINTTLNTSRGTTSVVYASVYQDPTDSAKYYLKVKSEITGTGSKIWINSNNGTSETAPANDAEGTVFNAAAWSTSINVDSGDNGTTNGMFKFVFKEYGTSANYNSTTGNGCYVTFSTRTNPLYTGEGDTTNQKYYKDIYIYFDGVNVEKFEDVSYDVTDDDWFMDIINADITNGGSEYISVEWYQVDSDGTLDTDTVWTPVNPTTGTYLIPDGSLYLSNGNDGIPNSGIESLVQAGIQTFANPELYNQHIIATPGISASSVINSTKNFVEGAKRRDMLYIIDPPFGLTTNEVADWHNGKSELSGAPTSAINSSYLTTYWSWLKIYDEDNAEYVWVPPSVVMIGKLAEIDNNYNPWAIPAGTTRGKITADDYEYSPDQDERDLIYDINGNLNINPIVDMPGVGLVIWGQKTLLRDNTALNRLNVRRMVIYAKKLIRTTLKGFMFEPNESETWARVTTAISNILEPIRQDGGITAYEVVFDETTTTPSIQDQNIMSGIIRVTPVKAVEAIELTFGITAQGVTLG